MTKGEATHALLEAIDAGNVEEACICAAHVTHSYGPGAVQDAVLHHVCALPERTAQLVAFAANRLGMCTHTRYRKDAPALRRLLSEMVASCAMARKAVRAAQPAGPQHEPRQARILSVNKPVCAAILQKYCTQEVFGVAQRILKGEDPGQCVDALLAVKQYMIEVPVPHVTAALSKDPVWMVWKMVTEVYECDSVLSKYLKDLHVLYKVRFRKNTRKELAVLLKDALWALNTKRVPQGSELFSNVAIEAAWKIQYVHLELEDAAAKAVVAANQRGARAGRAPAARKGAARSSEPDIISTMLL